MIGLINYYPNTELHTWLALNHILVGKPLVFLEVRKHFPNISDCFRESQSRLQALSLPRSLIAHLKNPDWESVEKEILWAEHSGQTILTLESPHYPAWLKTIPDPPPVLFVKGQLEVLGGFQLAVVGSRNPTHTGRSTAFDFAGALSRLGIGITSGLAIGIDAAAHEGALAVGGTTIAVLGTGLLHVYPQQNQSLAEAILEKGGALVSEFPLEKPARAIHFPMRNRIISGLSRGVLVVEATLRSGSLITARLALEQGREVFAIPSSIHNPLGKGCHALIRQGAKLVESTTDILEEFSNFYPIPSEVSSSQDVRVLANPTAKSQTFILSDTLSKEHKKILACVDHEPTPIDVIIARSTLPAKKVTALLLALELQGKVKTVGGGVICLE